MKQSHRQTSLRTQLILTVVFCWVLPILMITISGGYLLCRNQERALRQELDLAGSYAIEQTVSGFGTVFFESKTVSYDGIVRSAYRTYQTDRDSAALYRTVSNYLKQRFSRRDPINAMFVSFWNAPELKPYMSNQGDDSSSTMLNSYTEIESAILKDMESADTKIRLYEKNGMLYASRNLLDSRLCPYATVVIQCNLPYLVSPLKSLSIADSAYGEIDGICFSSDGSIIYSKESENHRSGTGKEFIGETDGHTITLHTVMRDISFHTILTEMPIFFIIIPVLMLVFLAALLWFFYRRFSLPVRTLVQATGRVRQGDRGYQITLNAESREFDALYSHFNAMSAELKNQFDLAIAEQESLHQARIKALQSQINPHFLNNTLEVINWEARIAGNEQITAMIEALATMLNTSLNRDDNPQISFRDEMQYTEAYLYIIKQRMGERLRVKYEIDGSLYQIMIPRMILQPIVENAVEHDLSHSTGGSLTIRASRTENSVCLYVEHDGHILPEDRSKLDRLLSDNNEPGDRVHIGIRNVSQRLRLLYGDKASLRIDEIQDGLVRAEILLPIN